MLDDLRVDVQSYVPPTSPFFYRGTAGEWDEDRLLRAFATANVIEIAHENKYVSSPWFGLNVGGGPNTIVMTASPVYPSPGPHSAALRVTKVGVVLRKEGVLDGRKTNRKWREWSMLLTGSQLLWSRDPAWVNTVEMQMSPARGETSLHRVMVPRPDELLSLQDAIAVFDRSYDRVSITVLFLRTLSHFYSHSSTTHFGWSCQMGVISFLKSRKRRK